MTEAAAPGHPALAAEQARAAAVMARDTTALQDLLDPALRYIHATGTRHDRSAYLQYVQTGPRFEQVSLQAEQVLPLGDDAVLLSGTLHLRFQRAGQAPQAAQSWASAVWRRQGMGWVLLSMQSTRPPET